MKWAVLLFPSVASLGEWAVMLVSASRPDGDHILDFISRRKDVILKKYLEPVTGESYDIVFKKTAEN